MGIQVEKRSTSTIYNIYYWVVSVLGGRCGQSLGVLRNALGEKLGSG